MSGNSNSLSRSRSPPHKIPENLLSSPLTKSLCKEIDDTYIKITNIDGIKIDYPEFMLKHTKTKPSIHYGFSRFNYAGYYKSREDIWSQEDPHIVDVMSEIINQKPSESEKGLTPILQPNDWFASNEKSFCSTESSQKKIMISHLQYSEDERTDDSPRVNTSKQRKPESPQKAKNVSNITISKSKKELSEKSSSSPSPPKLSDNESVGSMDSPPSPLLKRKYDDVQKSESSNEEIYDEPEEEFILKKTIIPIIKKDESRTKSDSSEFEDEKVKKSISKKKRKEDKISTSASKDKKHKKRDKSLSSSISEQEFIANKESGSDSNSTSEEIEIKKKSKKGKKKNIIKTSKKDKKRNKSPSISDDDEDEDVDKDLKKKSKKKKKSSKSSKKDKKKVKDSSTSDEDDDQEDSDKNKKRKDDKKDKDDGKGKKDDRGDRSGGKGDRDHNKDSSRHDKEKRRDRRSRSRSKDRGDKRSSNSRRDSDGRRRHPEFDFNEMDMKQLISACDLDPEVKSILTDSSDNVLKGLDGLLFIKKDDQNPKSPPPPQPPTTESTSLTIYNPYSNESSSNSDDNEIKNKSGSRRQSTSDFAELEFKLKSQNQQEKPICRVDEKEQHSDAYKKEQFLHKKVQELLSACDFDESIQSMLKSESSENVLKKINSVELSNIWDLGTTSSTHSQLNEEAANIQIKEALHSSGYGTEISSKLSSTDSSSSSSSSDSSSSSSSTSSSSSVDSDSENDSKPEQNITTVITNENTLKTEILDDDGGSASYDLSFLDPTLNCIQKIPTIESSSKNRDRDRDRYYDDYGNEEDKYNSRGASYYNDYDYDDDYEYSGRRHHYHHRHHHRSRRHHHHQDYYDYDNDYPTDHPIPIDNSTSTSNREVEIVNVDVNKDVKREENENSPKRISLDDRINLELSSGLGLGGGFPREQSFVKSNNLPVLSQNIYAVMPHYPSYPGTFPGVNQNQTIINGEVLDPFPRPRVMPRWLIGRPPSLTPVLQMVHTPSPLIAATEQQLNIKPILLQKTQSQQIVQLGNVIQVVPTAPAPTKDQQQIVQVESMADKFKMPVPLGINKSNKIKAKSKRLKVKVEKESPPEERADSPIVYVEKVMKPVEIPEKPPGKGILTPLEVRDKSSDVILKKAVKFKDGIKPGDGTSGSDGEGMSSPPAILFENPESENVMVVVKKKKLRKRAKVIKEEDDEIDENAPPPLPPSEEDYPYCDLTILYQNVPDFAELFVKALQEKGIKIEIPEIEQSVTLISVPQHVEVDVN